MNTTTLSELRVVLVEDPDASALDREQRRDVLAALLEAGHPVTRRAQPDPELPALARILGSGHGGDIDIEGVEPQAVAEQVTALREARALPQPGAWTPWFPVIDYDRCTNCMQCLSFCLFDVYGSDSADKIEVRNEDNCKTNCPACSRVCPEVAILFPKYTKGPINGDVVRATDIVKESMKVDISALLGGDIYSSLKDRAEGARKRFSTERDESKALLERKRCLKALKKDFDIPDEVLMTLPSAGEIQERAERARAKTERRRAASQSIKDLGGPQQAPSVEEWGI